MRRYGKPVRGLDMLRGSSPEQMRDILLKLAPKKNGRHAADLGDIFEATQNHSTRRRTIRSMRRRGRGYTRPLHGRSRTRGSGRGKATTRRFR